MTIIKTNNSNTVFKRKHDGFIFGNEIVLGKDFSIGFERNDLAEYYEEILDLNAPVPPQPTGYGVVIPTEYLWAFPNNKFILHGTGFEIPLTVGSYGKAVDAAYLTWEAFLVEIWKPENKTVFDILEPVWLYCETEADNNRVIQL
jgi:hypothetical protein